MNYQLYKTTSAEPSYKHLLFSLFLFLQNWKGKFVLKYSSILRTLENEKHKNPFYEWETIYPFLDYSIMRLLKTKTQNLHTVSHFFI